MKLTNRPLDNIRLVEIGLRNAKPARPATGAENDPIRRLDLEKRIADYWTISQTLGAATSGSLAMFTAIRRTSSWSAT